jgi:SAM-dependent methyltransferase
MDDSWNSGDPYEYFMGRWSTIMAPVFLKWLNFPSDKNWLDIGCGTGALSQAIEQFCSPQSLTCVDPSEAFLEKSKKRISAKATFKIGSAENIPSTTDSFELIASGLALNFFPDLDKALHEMKRVSQPKGVIAAYVWDYAGRMEFLRYFWDSAYQIDPESEHLDEGKRFSICNEINLAASFKNAGLVNIETTKLDIETVFMNFDDFWNPFLGGQGPAPSYLASLNKQKQQTLKNIIHQKLPFESDGSIKLLGRAIAVKGRCK